MILAAVIIAFSFVVSAIKNLWSKDAEKITGGDA